MLIPLGRRSAHGEHLVEIDPEPSGPPMRGTACSCGCSKVDLKSAASNSSKHSDGINCGCGCNCPKDDKDARGDSHGDDKCSQEKKPS